MPVIPRINRQNWNWIYYDLVELGLDRGLWADLQLSLNGEDIEEEDVVLAFLALLADSEAGKPISLPEAMILPVTAYLTSLK